MLLRRLFLAHVHRDAGCDLAHLQLLVRDAFYACGCGLAALFYFQTFKLGVQAARFALGLPPWLPAKLLATQLPPRFFRAVLEGASKFIGWIEKQLKPRWPWWTGSRTRLRLHAAMVGFCGFILLLPLVGIPFTNTLPALVIVIGMLGMMERDGVAIAAAYGLLVVTICYLGFFAGVMIELIKRAQHWLMG